MNKLPRQWRGFLNDATLGHMLPRVAVAVICLLIGSALGAAIRLPAKERADVEVVSQELRIHRTTYRDLAEGDDQAASGDPLGHVLSFSGVVNGSMLVTHEIRTQDGAQVSLIEGRELKREGFSFAGLRDDLVFIRSTSTLQIQREIQLENEVPNQAPEVLPREVIASFAIDQDINIIFE
jgi:hypothetical protein